jgi:AcrR family transcriptional regulator
MNTPTGYRGLRRTTSREALLGAAAELMGRRGLPDVSIDEIVARAGVAKGTFYNHFRDKQDIAHHIALGIRHEIRDRIGVLKLRSNDPALHLAIALSLFLGLAVESPQRARMLVTLLSDATDLGAPMNARVRMTLEAGQAGGRFLFPSLEAALILVLGIVAGGVQSILERPQNTVSEDLVLNLVRHALIGLGLTAAEATQTATAALAELSGSDAPESPIELK